MFKLFLFSFYSGCLLTSAIAMPGCKKQSLQPNPPPDSTVSSKTYLALGDSYTIGQNVPVKERFPYLTVASLRSQGITIQDPQYIATTGWTTMNLQNAITAQNPSANFDIVTLLIGVNDQYQHRDTADYRLRFTQLLTKAVALAGNRSNRVFVLSIPDYSATPFVATEDKEKVSKEIGWFNAINKQVTLDKNIAYIDITPLSREVINDPTLLTTDGLHYSGKEHQKWAALLVPLIKNALR